MNDRAAHASGGPSDASPEPREDAIRRRDLHWAQAVNDFDGLHEHPDTECSADVDRHRLLATLDAERTAHPVAASAADRDALYRRIHALPGLAHHGKGEQCYPITDAVLAALAAAPPRATEPAEAGLRALDQMRRDHIEHRDRQSCAGCRALADFDSELRASR